MLWCVEFLIVNLAYLWWHLKWTIIVRIFFEKQVLNHIISSPSGPVLRDFPPVCPVAGCKARHLTCISQLRNHWTEKHEPIIKMYTCGLCGFKTKRLRIFTNKHMATHHSTVAPHEHSMCQLDKNIHYLDPAPYSLKQLEIRFKMRAQYLKNLQWNKRY